MEERICEKDYTIVHISIKTFCSLFLLDLVTVLVTHCRF